MAYNANIPQSTDQLSVSQGNILDNFQALASVVLSNNGAITFPNQGVLPTFPANQLGLYALTPASTGVSELFVNKNVAAGGVTQIPFTASTLSNTATPAQFSTGWSYLPSGLILKWGSAPSTSISTNIPFDATVPFTQLFSLQLTALAPFGAPPLVIASITGTPATGFIFGYVPNPPVFPNPFPNAYTVLYFAIGY